MDGKGRGEGRRKAQRERSSREGEFDETWGILVIIQKSCKKSRTFD